MSNSSKASKLIDIYANSMSDLISNSEINEYRKFADNVIKNFSESKEIMLTLKSKVVSKEIKAKFVEELCKKLSISKKFNNFLQVICLNNRAHFIIKIISKLIQILDQRQGITAITIYSASDIKTQTKNKIIEAISKPNIKYVAEFKSNADLLGGIIIEINNTIFDGSISNKLKLLERNIIKEIELIRNQEI